MANPVFKHQDDDGDLSIFASGNVVLLACVKGHYWVLEAQQQSIESVKPVLDELTTPDMAEMLMRTL